MFIVDLNKRWRKVQTIFLSILLFYILALPLILLDYNAGRAFSDQHLGHLPAIRFFTEQLDFSNYPSATTPGYHLLIAAFAKLFSQNIIFLKLISSLITAVFIGVFAALLYDKTGKVKTIILLLPMIFSLYILPDGVWLVPDNMAWLTVSILLLLPATGRPPTIPYFACSGLVLLIAILVRQPNIWLASVPWATGLSYLLFSNSPNQKKMICIWSAILCTIPAFFLLWYFYSIWGGLVPPTVQARHERELSYCVPPFFFSIFFVYSFFYAPILFSAIKDFCNRRAYFWVRTTVSSGACN